MDEGSLCQQVAVLAQDFSDELSPDQDKLSLTVVILKQLKLHQK